MDWKLFTSSACPSNDKANSWSNPVKLISYIRYGRSRVRASAIVNSIDKDKISRYNSHGFQDNILSSRKPYDNNMGLKCGMRNELRLSLYTVAVGLICLFYGRW